MLKTIKTSPFFIRLFNWEYWPFHFVYMPIYPIWLWYCLKARSLFFFAAANPYIKNGGFLMESKRDIFDLIPEQYTPNTLLFTPHTPETLVAVTVAKKKFSYPLIIKPDIGMQGKAVIKINSEKELMEAASKFTVDYIIQPFVAFPNEIGIFYVRYPGETKGKITGIVEKEFLAIVGDGVSTIEQLLHLNNRYILQISSLQKSLGEGIFDILKPKETRILVPYGNHARGSLFMDSTFKNNEKIENVIDTVCQSIPGFYYGRLDIRFTDFKELGDNKNWSIIELNGAGSEPTHIYDPRHSIFFAWREIITHWHLLYKVSRLNREKGEKYLTFKEGIKMFTDNTRYIKKISQIDFSDN